jgi:hypothetical protein
MFEGALSKIRSVYQPSTIWYAGGSVSSTEPLNELISSAAHVDKGMVHQQCRLDPLVVHDRTLPKAMPASVDCLCDQSSPDRYNTPGARRKNFAVVVCRMIAILTPSLIAVCDLAWAGGDVIIASCDIVAIKRPHTDFELVGSYIVNAESNGGQVKYQSRGGRTFECSTGVSTESRAEI